MKNFRSIVVLFIFCGLITMHGFTQNSRSDYSVYSGKHLKKLRVPVGGIGTGNFLIGGRGDIQHIEIFNRPDRTRKLIKSFFSIWLKKGQNEPISKILERELLPPYEESTHKYVYGLPRFQEVTFTNHFPIPKWTFQDEDIPLNISMEAFNPFVPLDLDKSSYPITVFYWHVENPNDETVEFSIALNLENPIKATNIRNEVYEQNGVKGLRFAAIEGADQNYQGAMIVGTTRSNTLIQTHWYDGRWRDDAHIFWRDFSDDGKITEFEEPWDTSYKPVSYNETSRRNSSLLVTVTLGPGGKTTIPFYISWYFPKRIFTVAETFGIETAAGKVFENYYVNNFSDASDVIHTFLANEKELYELTANFSNLLQSSTYPDYVIEALTTQASTIKTNLIQFTREGDAHGFEGVSPSSWCCPGTCTHVWNYEQTLASLYPKIERSMRTIEFTHNTFENGFQTHRSVIPLGDYWFDGPAAADGQMGSIIRTYREWKISGDNQWLTSIWSKVKKAMQFAWYGPGEVSDPRFKHQEAQDAWDPDKKGIMTGRQHNTYDISFFGPNSMTSSLYLAALKASSEMAAAMGEAELSQDFLHVYEKGVSIFEDSLWNGNYFVQIIAEDSDHRSQEDFELSPVNPDGKAIPKYQYGDGCLADQLLGQYLAHISGLGYILDKSKVDEAMFQIYQHNFLRELRDFSNVQRVYALNDESGVILCSWPNGNRPLLPFVYADEVWTGVEYQVAASLIYSDYFEEGLEIVKAIQDRHDGYKRNPFEHDESGTHYARAMSSWSLLLALSGFEYDGVVKSMKFSPNLNVDDFLTFWSTGNAWGAYQIKEEEAILSVDYGTLELNEFIMDRDITLISKIKGASVKENRIVFKEGLALNPGENLHLSVKKPTRF